MALRNAAHKALTAKFGTEDWFSLFFRGEELIKFETTRQGIEDKHPVPVRVDKLVSELTLGFWTMVFAKKYRKVWWDTADDPGFAMRRVLSGLPTTSGSSRSHLMQRAMYFLVLRNRVSHHESILEGIEPFGLPRLDTEEVHALLTETLGWISPVLLEHASPLDRFQDVWTRTVRP